MIVVDASVVVEIVLRMPAAAVLQSRLFEPGLTLYAPHLLDIEVAQAVRRSTASGYIDPERGREALADLADFPLHRYPHAFLLQQVWDLRNNLSAYDAVYVALAQTLDALLTRQAIALASSCCEATVFDSRQCSTARMASCTALRQANCPREGDALFNNITHGLFRYIWFKSAEAFRTRKGGAMSSSDVTAADVTLSADQGVSAATAFQVRRAIYSHDRLTRSDMDLVFDVARKAGREPCLEWTGLFCEALTDYVVHQNVPQDYIPQDKADWLVSKLKQSDGISSKAEFEMLIDVMTHAVGVPASLSTFALSEIAAAIMNGRRAAITGEDRPAGVVTETDVEALRAVLYAAKAGSAGHVTKDEAEVLFQIAHRQRLTSRSIFR